MLTHLHDPVRRHSAPYLILCINFPASWNLQLRFWLTLDQRTSFCTPFKSLNLEKQTPPHALNQHEPVTPSCASALISDDFIDDECRSGCRIGIAVFNNKIVPTYLCSRSEHADPITQWHKSARKWCTSSRCRAMPPPRTFRYSSTGRPGSTSTAITGLQEMAGATTKTGEGVGI